MVNPPKVMVEVLPISNEAKGMMSSTEEHTLESILKTNGPNSLKTTLDWIRNPGYDGIPKLVGIRKTGEQDPTVDGAHVYCATVELPSSYLNKYTTTIMSYSQENYEVRSLYFLF